MYGAPRSLDALQEILGHVDVVIVLQILCSRYDIGRGSREVEDWGVLDHTAEGRTEQQNLELGPVTTIAIQNGGMLRATSHVRARIS